jgi:hypothetical protein
MDYDAYRKRKGERPQDVAKPIGGTLVRRLAIDLSSYRQFLVMAGPVRRRRLWGDNQSVWR